MGSLVREPVSRSDVKLPSQQKLPQLSYSEYLKSLRQAQSLLKVHSYCIPLYILLARLYLELAYPDLAAGSAYKALLLSDAARDECDEYHDQATEALGLRILLESGGDEVMVKVVEEDDGARDEDCTIEERGDRDASDERLYETILPDIYTLLCRSLVLCGCYQTALQYSSQAVAAKLDGRTLRKIRDGISEAVAAHFKTAAGDLECSQYEDPSTWPDRGFVRRECYPWNELEPDRLNELDKLNEMLFEVAPHLEVRVVELPALVNGTQDNSQGISRQLGVFAKEDVPPGEIVLDETSMLTANNKLQDALCDGCSADLPELDNPDACMTVSCTNCDVVFCSQACHDRAVEEYHPALCEMDVESIAKDVPAKEAADSLYSLLLLRSLAMAETQEVHPLELRDIKYIWADFHNLPPELHWRASGSPTSPSSSSQASTTLPQTLPFSFEQNIRLPFHMLEKMDIDIFANPQYDVWVFNTLYAKFRGTASARLSGLGGRAIRGPEVSAVHFLWCLANHSCDPNVSWEWGGSVQFWVREERVKWKGKNGEEVQKSSPGLRKDEEVFNHYCDVDLPVGERREWARGALGGDCRCERCVWEAAEKDQM